MIAKKTQLFFELLFVLVKKELTVRYKGSVLGYFWALLNPFAFALVYFIAFKLVMRVQIENYPIFLITGMFPWLWLTNSIIHAASTYKNNSSLVKRVNINRIILPLSNIVYEMIHFILALPILFFFLYLSGGAASSSWLWQIPLMLVIEFLLIFPFATILAITNVYINDIEYLVSIFISLLFFVTPIVYPLNLIPEAFKGYFELNPTVNVLNAWRSVFLEGTLDLNQLFYPIVLSVILLCLSVIIYKKFSPKLGELL